jgi:hypothetical protein
MAITARVYKNGSLLATGTAVLGSKDITGVTAFKDAGANDVPRRVGHKRSVHVVFSGGVSSNGVIYSEVWTDQRLLAIPANTLTLISACPFT